MARIKGEAAIRLIRTLVEQTIAEIDDGEGQQTAKTFYASHDQLVKLISAMDPEEVSDRDYINDDTGEVYLEFGEKAGHSNYYPHSDEPTPVNKDQDDYEVENEEDYDRDERLEKVLASFESDFNVESGDLLELVDDPEEMREMGYDVDLVVPKSIKRHDNRPFTRKDLDAVGKYIEAWIERTGRDTNVSLLWNKKAGGTEIEISPTFS